jgi:hypothetical protein
MSLYLEILDHDHSASHSAPSDGADASILDRWTSETTGGLVRLVDVLDPHVPARSVPRSMRILFN